MPPSCLPKRNNNKHKSMPLLLSLPGFDCVGNHHYVRIDTNRDAQSLLPLTVKQIYDALQTNDDKANLIVDGVDVNNVRRVCNKAERVTDVTFVLDDGTGRLNVINGFMKLLIQMKQRLSLVMAKPFAGIQFPTIPVDNKAHCKILYLEYTYT
ncbi:Replication protein [Vigna angularis]|uniref:Replication protein n=1 Tax=Phaseolus angularis TaxID=3914 RepID=A0A8T0K821_PHAAN|nr:Replication protein [Vigna angularis]